MHEKIQAAVKWYPCDLLFIHRDAEGQSLLERKAEIDEAVSLACKTVAIPPAIAVVPVRMTEAWLLFDIPAIRAAAGNPNGSVDLDLPRLADVEGLPLDRDDGTIVVNETISTKWYAAGLHFECAVCGRCCAGPGEGYIWATRPEIERIAKHLNVTPEELRCRFLHRVGLRTTIVEHSLTKDCIFLRAIGGTKQCAIYSVRPSQCRSWPFWPENLANPDAWNRAAMRCPGINRGRLYTGEDIERIRENRPWWEHAKSTGGSSKK